MTQAINFDNLKSAFAPVTESAIISQLNDQSVEPIALYKGDSSSKLEQENRHLSDQILAMGEKFESIEQAYQKSLRHINALMQEKSGSDDTLQNLHNDKIRLHRVLNEKQTDIENLKKTINKSELNELKIRTTLTHSKRDQKKLESKNEALTSEIQSLMRLVKSMRIEVANLKQQRTVTFIMKTRFIELLCHAKETIKEFSRKISISKRNNNVETPVIEWTPAIQKLPTTQCMVFVRNGSEADIAVFEPKTRRFKCANKTIKVIEWAYAN